MPEKCASRGCARPGSVEPQPIRRAYVDENGIQRNQKIRWFLCAMHSHDRSARIRAADDTIKRAIRKAAEEPSPPEPPSSGATS